MMSPTDFWLGRQDWGNAGWQRPILSSTGEEIGSERTSNTPGSHSLKVGQWDLNPGLLPGALPSPSVPVACVDQESSSRA